ncbi:hypothetical protein ASL14_02585 [Paenibacillus sp. IHB B 3084]|uniref:DUF86 domain-containing protein n=1 Tax=Paenibacillus TaxID=44249 RepID=UPI00071F911F|nr:MULTISPECIES: HepT-like ribonuclease domain-containing protein [Paenibacillus]ALP35230.1 hypothetical protein ASL14_02585 [Paenibacillus sp. IHB B 3084]MBE0336600.1 DUF86 domain-containing protein [Paenibacillus sp. 23TSA30-6]
MYYVNREQIELRLGAVPDIAAGLRRITAAWNGDLLQGLVQERCLHLAIETVTDVGSYIIDGFIMRDASSYEDIIGIIHEEGVLDDTVFNPIMELVALRKPLVQEYFHWDRTSLHPLTPELPELLERFASSVHDYLNKELGPQPEGV